MHPALRIRPHALAIALALLFAAGGAHAQCLITGPSTPCGGPVELCGPDGLYEWVWTDPSGAQSYNRCLIATQPGPYSLVLFDMFGGTFGPCSLLVATAEPPVCEITGPSSACEGSSVELCGPQGDLEYQWSGPGGFSDSAACVRVSARGVYRLAVRRPDGCAGTVCEHTVSFATCRTLTNCPRPAWFWMRQCLVPEPSAKRMDRSQLQALAACVEGRAQVFDWHDASAGFCATMQPRPARLPARARRQFAAVLANVCAGEIGLPAFGEHVIALDPATPVELPGVSTTVGAWLAAADTRLVELEALDRGDPGVKQAYRSLIRAGWLINHGRGMGPVCGHAAEGVSAALAFAESEDDPEEPLAGELADDDSDSPGPARATPNPFSVTTTLEYTVAGPATEEVALAVYDLAGRRVRELVRGPQAPGLHEARWDGRGADGARMQSGVYFVRGRIGERSVTGQLTLMD